jgi:hypothetical protein
VEGYRVAHNALKAHAAVVELYRWVECDLASLALLLLTQPLQSTVMCPLLSLLGCLPS